MMTRNVGDIVLVCVVPANPVRYARIVEIFNGGANSDDEYAVVSIDRGDTAVVAEREIGKQACLAWLRGLIKQIEAMEDE